MPQLRVLKNGEPICVVGSDDVWMFSASVWADVWGPEASTLDISGGSKRRIDGTHDFLIWAMPHDLVRGDSVDLHFDLGAESNPKGTVFEPDPDATMADGKQKESGPSVEEELWELEARPLLNCSTKWKFALNGATPMHVGPDVARQHLGLHLLWNEEHPERLRVSLSKSSLREICARTGCEELLLQYVPLGSHVTVVVEA